MLFNELIFLFFIVIVFGGYMLPVSWTVKKIFLLLMSYGFYASWNPPYLLIIIFSTLVDYLAARRIQATSVQSRKRLWLTVSLVANLGVLTYFKYGGFLLENFVVMMDGIGITYEPAPWSVILPVGISFFTFQTLTYSIDVYRGKYNPDDTLLDFAVFVTFFPQLAAGPIVRARKFLPQLKVMPPLTLDNLGWGAVLVLIGLFEKVVIADGLLSPIVDRVYNHTDGTLPAMTVFLGNFAFMGQIFGDFSGYSLMAIGMALALGFVLPENFRAPFAAIGLGDFWRRWHVTMSGWFRDYVYASIRVKDSGLVNTMIAQFLTMTIVGLWHGASWTFVVWGCFNGLVVASEIALRNAVGHWRIWHTRIATLGFWALTMVIFSQSATLFRAVDFDQSRDFFLSFFVAPDTPFYLTFLDRIIVIATLGGLFLAHWQLKQKSLRQLVDQTPVPVVIGVGVMMIASIAAMGGTRNAFIYFQF